MANNQNKNQNQNGGGTTNQKKRRFFRKTNNKPSGNGSQNDGSNQKVQAKRELRFHMHDAQARKLSESYEKIKKAIILKIQETFEDSDNIVESLKKKQKKVINKPDYKKYVSTLTDPDEKAAENTSLEKEWERDFQIFCDDQKKFKNNWHKAYAMIWKNYCSKEVQVAIEEISDFKARIENDPLELLNEIETLMHVPQRAKYPPLTLVEVLYEFLRVKQGDKESLIDYLNRFKSEVEVVKRLFGKSITDGYAEAKDEYKNTTDDVVKKKVKKDSWDEFISVLFLRNSNHARFSGMMLDFRKSFANNDDKYPKDLLSMMDVMRQQPEPKKTRQPTTNKDQDKDKEDGASNFAQTEKGKTKWACYCCGNEKCRLSNCTKKATLPKEKWHRPKFYVEPSAQSNAQTTEADTCQAQGSTC